MDAMQRLQAELATLHARLGELDTVTGDIERERAQLRQSVARCRATLQALAEVVAAAPPAKPLRAVPCSEAHPGADVYHPGGHPEGQP